MVNECLKNKAMCVNCSSFHGKSLLILHKEMQSIQSNYSLQAVNTFGFDVMTDFYTEITSLEELKALVTNPIWQNIPHLILGGGSNVLFTKPFHGLVIKNNLKGIEVIHKDEKNVWIKSAGGENWHEFVQYCVENQFAGVENLSLIPGTVGAAPMQNIGAYGVEIKDVFDSLEAFHVPSGEIHTFTLEECRFGYRESIFKHEAKGLYFITSVTFKLSLVPEFRLDYGAIQETLQTMGITTPTLRAVSDAVCAIRRSKLPNPAEIGNAGSFFKNPEVPQAILQKIQEQYPNVPFYALPNGQVKIPAGWLIEQAGWKGKRFDAIGVHAKQALVLVHYGGGKGQDVANLAHEIQKDIATKFGISLQTEVNFI